MSHKELVVIIPVYNEQEIIETVIQNWIFLLDGLNINFEIKTYNDGSKDNSSSILQKLKKTNDRLTVINKSNSGHGPTILQGYKESLNSDWIFQTDSDNEIDANYFTKLWEQKDEFDFLIGNRKNRKTPRIRKLITAISRITISFLYSSKIYDVNCPYRLMNTKKIESVLTKIPENTLAPNLIISGMAGKKNLRIFELIVEYSFRTTGEVSIKKWKLLKFSAKSFLQTFLFRLQNS